MWLQSKVSTYCVPFFLSFTLVRCKLFSPSTKIVNLAYDFVEGETIYWPTASPFNITVFFKGYSDLGFYYEANDFCAAEHGGTHIDSPIHFAKGKMAVHEIAIDQIIGEGIVVDVSSKTINNADYQVTVDDLKLWEKLNGRIPDDSILLINTGWAKFYPDRKTYLGTDTKDVSLLHFPGMHPDTASWLVKNRKIKVFGLDTASLDYGQSKLFESHQILFQKNIPGLENLANLDKLPPRGFTVIGLPMKIRGGSGAPLGIIAVLDSSDGASRAINGSMIEISSFIILLQLVLAFVYCQLILAV